MSYLDIYLKEKNLIILVLEHRRFKKAIQNAEPTEEIILIAGKGHEASTNLQE